MNGLSSELSQERGAPRVRAATVVFAVGLVPLLLALPTACSEERAPEAPKLAFDDFDAGPERAPTRSGEATGEPSAQGAPEGEEDAILFEEDDEVAPDLPNPKGPSGAAQLPSASLTPAQGAAGPSDPAASLTDGGLRIAATTIASPVYERPHTIAKKLGYVRLGGTLAREAEPTPGSGCKGKWYAVEPRGFVCTDDATTDMQAPLVRATQVRPALDRPLPYAYGFVRATAPQYLRVPSKADQLKSEFKLEEHLAWYREHRAEIQRVTLGANDVPLNPSGIAQVGLLQPADFRLSTQKSITELLGGRSPRGTIPFWLDGGRKIPNVSGFEVPEYAAFADRVRRKTGLSFVDAFVATDDDIERRFAVTVDMRLVPGTKIKPDTGSPFHGVEVGGHVQMPFAFVARRGATTYKLLKGRDEASPDASLPRRALVPLSGKVRIKAGARFYQLLRDPKRWLKGDDIGVVAPPPAWPAGLGEGEKWIDISLVQQTLVLYRGLTPEYATLVSTGRDRLGDPKTSMGTPQGTFRLQSKHIAAAMDSEENSSVAGGSRGQRTLRLSAEDQATISRLLAAEAAGTSLDAQDRHRLSNVKKGRHPEYGVTMRRGAGDFELRDVPWIQYFSAGYALHGAYWHDVFGTPRSHGCVNLSPIDARFVFNWTEPSVPEGWHGINVSDAFGTGTLVHVRQ